MAAPTKFHSYIAHLCHGGQGLDSDAQFMLALSNAANPPSASADSVLTDIVQISYTNLSSRLLSNLGEFLDGSGRWKVQMSNKVLSASGGAVAAFRYITVYNANVGDTPADALISYYDMGEEITLKDGEQITIQFSGDLIGIQ